MKLLYIPQIKLFEATQIWMMVFHLAQIWMERLLFVERWFSVFEFNLPKFSNAWKCF